MKNNYRACGVGAAVLKIFFLPVLLLFFFSLSTTAQQLLNPPNIEWQKTLGGSGMDEVYDVKPTSDNGYLVAGFTYSNDGDVSGNHGGGDCWLVKLNGLFEISWKKCLGGSGYDGAASLAETNTGDFIVAADTYSFDGDVTGTRHGADPLDCWVIKITIDGNLLWQKAIGGYRLDLFNAVAGTADGGCILAGVSNSEEFEISCHHGDNITSDCWIVKMDGNGNIQWDQSIGGKNNDGAKDIKETRDGGYIFIGYTRSTDGNISGNHGGMDCLAVKLNSCGHIVWQKCYGGTGDEMANAIEEKPDLSGYIIVGKTNSADGDAGGVFGGYDIFIISIDLNGNIVWTTTYGGSLDENALSVKRDFASGDGYVIAGSSASNDNYLSGNHGGIDCWIIRITTVGDMVWQKSLGGSLEDNGSAFSKRLTMVTCLRRTPNQMTAM